MKHVTIYTDAGYCEFNKVGYFGAIIESDDLSILLSSCIFNTSGTQLAELEGIYNTLYFLKDLINSKDYHITIVNDNIINLHTLFYVMKNHHYKKSLEHKESFVKTIALLRKYKNVTILHKRKGASQHIHMCDLMARFVKKNARISSLKGRLLEPFTGYQRVKLKTLFN